jgi:hypothetical protein
VPEHPVSGLPGPLQPVDLAECDEASEVEKALRVRIPRTAPHRSYLELLLRKEEYYLSYLLYLYYLKRSLASLLEGAERQEGCEFLLPRSGSFSHLWV